MDVRHLQIIPSIKVEECPPPLLSIQTPFSTRRFGSFCGYVPVVYYRRLSRHLSLSPPYGLCGSGMKSTFP